MTEFRCSAVGRFFLLLCALACFSWPAVGVTAPAQPGEKPQASERTEALANLTHPVAEVRQAAISTLGKVGAPGDAPVLLSTLRDPDEASARLAEAAVWELWGRSGDKRVDAIFNQGVYALRYGRLATAAELFSAAIKRKPAFAEAWNKRATTYFLMGDYQRARKDCDEVLRRNPQHFGALAGYGQIYMRLDEPKKAVRYLRQALAINPNMDEVGELIEQIETALEERRGQTI